MAALPRRGRPAGRRALRPLSGPSPGGRAVRRRATFSEGMAFGGASFALSAIVGLASSVAIARLYGASTLGALALAQAPALALAYLSTAQEQAGLVRQLSVLAPRAPRVTGLFAAVFAFSLGLTLVVAAIAVPASYLLLHGPLHHPELFGPSLALIASYVVVENTNWNLDMILSAFRAGRRALLGAHRSRGDLPGHRRRGGVLHPVAVVPGRGDGRRPCGRARRPPRRHRRVHARPRRARGAARGRAGTARDGALGAEDRAGHRASGRGEPGRRMGDGLRHDDRRHRRLQPRRAGRPAPGRHQLPHPRDALPHARRAPVAQRRRGLRPRGGRLAALCRDRAAAARRRRRRRRARDHGAVRPRLRARLRSVRAAARRPRAGRDELGPADAAVGRRPARDRHRDRRGPHRAHDRARDRPDHRDGDHRRRAGVRAGRRRQADLHEPHRAPSLEQPAARAVAGARAARPRRGVRRQLLPGERVRRRGAARPAARAGRRHARLQRGHRDRLPAQPARPRARRPRARHPERRLRREVTA